MSGYINSIGDGEGPRTYVSREDCHATALALTESFIRVKGQIEPEEAADYYLKVVRRLQQGR